MNWQLIWQVVFVGLFLGFGVMSVLVIINGARDVRRLLTHLEDSQRSADNSLPEEARSD